MITVYIIEGSTGEYSDHREWPVAVYLHEDLAKRHIELATQRAHELMQKYDNNYCSYRWGSGYNQRTGPLPEDINIYDLDMQWDYTGINYNYYKIEVRESLPTKSVY